MEIQPVIDYPPGPIPSMSNSDDSASATSSEASDSLEFKHFTAPDQFGVYRAFLEVPRHDPEADWEVEDLADAPSFVSGSKRSVHWATGLGDDPEENSTMPYGPFTNASTFQLMDWYYESQGVLSLARLDALVNDVILSPEFKPRHLGDFTSGTELKKMDEYLAKGPFSESSGWKESILSIPMPAEGVSHASEGPEDGGAPHLQVPHVHHRNLTQLIKTAFASEAAADWTYIPYAMYNRKTPDSEPERIITEVYHSDAWLSEHEALQKLPVELDEGGDIIEKAIVSVQVYSDGTRLAQFGSASLWPAYVFFGNQSKYDRGVPSKFGAHHLAYIPDVCDYLFCFCLHQLIVLFSYLKTFKTNTPKRIQDFARQRQPSASLSVNSCMVFGV